MFAGCVFCFKFAFLCCATENCVKNAPHCFNKLQLENFTSVKFSIFNLHGGWFSFAACLEECHTFATDPKKTCCGCFNRCLRDLRVAVFLTYDSLNTMINWYYSGHNSPHERVLSLSVPCRPLVVRNIGLFVLSWLEGLSMILNSSQYFSTNLSTLQSLYWANQGFANRTQSPVCMLALRRVIWVLLCSGMLRQARRLVSYPSFKIIFKKCRKT